MQIPELPEATPEQRRHRTVALAALAIGGVTFFGVVFGLPGGGGSDEPSQTVAAKSGPNTEAILAAERVKEARRQKRAERRAVRRRRKANAEWKQLKEQYDAMRAGGGTGDPGADQPSQPAAPAESAPTPAPAAPQAAPEAPAPTTTPQPTTPAQPASGGDPRFYGLP